MTDTRRARLAQQITCAALAMLLVLSEVFSSSIQSTLPQFSSVCRLALTGGAAALLLVKCLFLTVYDDRRQLFVVLGALAYAAFAFLYSKDQWFFLIVLAGLAAKDIDLRAAVKVYLATAASGLLLVQLLHYTTDLIPFSFYCRNWDFGYGHYNGYGARLLGVFLAWAWLRWPRLRWWDLAGLTGILIYTMLVPGSRGAMGAMALVLLLFVLLRLAPGLLHGRWAGVLAVGSYPLLSAASLLLARWFDPNDPFAVPLLGQLNRLLSGRLEVWNHMLFHTPLWHDDWTELCYGPQVRLSLLGGVMTDSDVHHSIDNTYLAVPLNKGLLGGVLVAAVFMLLLWRLWKGRHTGELVLMLSLMAYLLMENKPFLIAVHPLFLLLPCALLTPRGKPLNVVCPPDKE